jgi:hypothetical protein
VFCFLGVSVEVLILLARSKHQPTSERGNSHPGRNYANIDTVTKQLLEQILELNQPSLRFARGGNL